jgi:hypothetical protein
MNHDLGHMHECGEKIIDVDLQLWQSNLETFCFKKLTLLKMLRLKM